MFFMLEQTGVICVLHDEPITSSMVRKSFLCLGLCYNVVLALTQPGVCVLNSVRAWMTVCPITVI